MTRKTSLLARASDLFAILGAAASSAAAVEGHRAPRSRDLKVLGIDAAAFRTIGR